MKKGIFAIFIAGVIAVLTSCGGGSSEEAKELLSQILTVVGIPQDIIMNICQDSDDDEICSPSELNNISLVKSSNFFSKIVLGENNTYELRNYDPTKNIIMELQDKDNIELNDGNFSLKYRGTTTELSILQSMVDNNDINQSDTKSVKKLQEVDTFYSVLLSSFEKNLNRYMKNDIPQRDARDLNLKELGRVFKSDIPLKDLPDKIKKQCGDNRECIRELIKSFPVNLDTDEQTIYTLAQTRRKVKLVNDTLIEKFTCNSNERKIIRHYGFEDIFSLKNGVEHAHPSINVLREIGNRAILVNYDTPQKNGIFAENIKRLPRKFRKGIIYIGLKSSGGKLIDSDRLYIGEYKKSNPTALFSANLTDLKGLGWKSRAINNKDEIYYNEFKNIKFSDGNKTLLDYLKETTRFDVVVAKSTPVDFISIATCSLKNPEAEIKEVLNIFKCPSSSELVRVVGGSVDAFSDTADKNATPSETLLSSIDKPIIGYDELADNKVFLDSLNIPNDKSIIKAQFSVGIKPTPKYLYQNDTIHIGSYELNNYTKFRLYGDSSDSVSNLWNREILISNGERVIQANLRDINLSSGTALNILNRDTLFDILIQNDTSVDFTYLNMCVQ